MDPALFTLPEVILNEREDFNSTPSRVSSHHRRAVPADWSAPQVEPHHHKPSESPSKTSPEDIGTAGLLGPSEACPTLDESTSARISTVVETLRQMADSIPGPNQSCLAQGNSNLSPVLPHLIPIFPGTTPPLLETCSWPSFLLQTPSPIPSLTPVLLHTPSPLHYSCWMNMTPVASVPSPAFGFYQYLLVPVSQCLAPCPLFVLPECRPSWCSCPHMVSAHPPCIPDLVQRETAREVSEQFNITLEVTPPGMRNAQDIMWAGSEEYPHMQSKPDQEDNLQASYTEVETESDAPCGSTCFAEETLAEQAFEDFMESLCTKENENEGKEREDSSIQEFLDRLCSDDGLIQEVDSIQNTENLDCPLSSEPEPIDFFPLRELQQESLSDILEQLWNPPSGDSNVVSSETEEKSLETLLVEAPEQRTHPTILDPPSTQIDTNPNHNGRTLFLEEPLPTDSRMRYYNVENRPSCDGSLFMDDGFTWHLEFFLDISSHNSLTSELDARESAAMVEKLSSLSPSRDLLQESSTSIFNLDDTESDQAPQKLQEQPWIWDPPSYETPLSPSVSESNGDLQTITNLLSVQPKSANPLSALVLTAMPQPPAQTKEPGEQHSSKTTNPKSSRFEDYPVPVQANSSFHADSKAESSDPLVDANLSETPKDQEVPQEFASCVVSLEIKTGESSEIVRKCGRTLGKGLETAVTQLQMDSEAREEGGTQEATEGKEENKGNRCKGRTNGRRSQRLSGQIKKEEASLWKPIEDNTGKPSLFTSKKDEKPRRRSSRGRQLHERELGDFAEQLSEMGEQVQSQTFVEEIDSQRLSGPIEGKEERVGLEIPVMKSTQEKDEKPRRRRSSRGKPSPERELGVFEKTKTAQQVSEMHHQEPAGEKEKLKVEDESKCEDNTPKVSPEIEAENALLTDIAQEEKELDKGATEEEGIPRSNVERTRSTTKEERLHQSPLPEHAGRYFKQLEIKPSPKREMQDDRELEDATGRQTLLPSSPMKRNKGSRDEEESLGGEDDADATGCKTKAVKVSEDCDPVAQPESPLKCPRIQTNTPEEPPEDGQSNKINVLSLVITCENNPRLSPIQSSDKTVTSSGGDVTGIETWDFYSMRSGTAKLNVSKRTQDNKAPKMAHYQSNPEMSQDQTVDGDERLNTGRDAGCLSLGQLSPTKRRASKEKESGGHQRGIVGLSPLKRGRWRSRNEANLDGGGVQDSTASEGSEDKDEVGTSCCKKGKTERGKRLRSGRKIDN